VFARITRVILSPREPTTRSRDLSIRRVSRIRGCKWPYNLQAFSARAHSSRAIKFDITRTRNIKKMTSLEKGRKKKKRTISLYCNVFLILSGFCFSAVAPLLLLYLVHLVECVSIRKFHKNSGNISMKKQPRRNSN